jgi:quinol monooxygenase YgiN
MISVLASITVKPGCREKFLAIFKSNVPAVIAENGCLEYRPTVDAPAGLAPQKLDADLVTIIEKWSSLDALRLHLTAPHMATYREKVKDLVSGVSLKVLQDA